MTVDAGSDQDSGLQAADNGFDAAAGGLVEVNAGDDDGGKRLDKFLAEHIADLSRSRLQALIKSQCVRENGRTISDPGSRVKPNLCYGVDVPPALPAEPAPEALQLSIVHEDAHVIVIDKPAGLVVHPAAGHETGTLVNALIAHCGDRLSGIGGVKRPGIVHRLDKDTSGLLVVAKTDRAHKSLSEQFAAHGRDGRMSRSYKAIVWGVPVRPKGLVDAHLGRSKHNRKKMAVVKETLGRHAVTHYAVKQVFAGKDGQPVASLMQLELETGRTHQIRVHMAHISHPLLGDPLYGSGFKASARHLSQRASAYLERLNRQALHAYELGFEHPDSGEAMSFERPLPKDMTQLIAALT